jgi:hypothetical protein
MFETCCLKTVEGRAEAAVFIARPKEMTSRTRDELLASGRLSGAEVLLGGTPRGRPGQAPEPVHTVRSGFDWCVKAAGYEPRSTLMARRVLLPGDDRGAGVTLDV